MVFNYMIIKMNGFICTCIQFNEIHEQITFKELTLHHYSLVTGSLHSISLQPPIVNPICTFVPEFLLIKFCLGFAGTLTGTLSCPELQNTKHVHDISLSEDGKMLALACREEGVKLFTLTAN